MRCFFPRLQLLTGFGFLLMVSMRDPLRDTLEFKKFAIGVFAGSLLLALPAFAVFDYRRLSRWCYTPLFAALGLFRPADGIRPRTCGQRRESQSRHLPARRADQGICS